MWPPDPNTIRVLSGLGGFVVFEATKKLGLPRLRGSFCLRIVRIEYSSCTSRSIRIKTTASRTRITIVFVGIVVVVASSPHDFPGSVATGMLSKLLCVELSNATKGDIAKADVFPVKIDHENGSDRFHSAKWMCFERGSFKPVGS